MLEACANPANGARVGIDGLGLQAFELQVLEVRLVLPVKVIGVDSNPGMSLSERF